MIDQEAIFKIFEKVLSNKEAARMALKNPRKLVLPTSSGTEKQGAAKIEMNKQSNHSGANHE